MKKVYIISSCNGNILLSPYTGKELVFLYKSAAQKEVSLLQELYLFPLLILKVDVITAK